MSYIDFFHSEDNWHTDNDVQLRISNGVLRNKGTATLEVNASSVISKSTDSHLTNSIGSINITNSKMVRLIFKSIIGNDDFTFSVWVKPFGYTSTGACNVCEFDTIRIGCYLRDDQNGKSSIFLEQTPFTRYLRHQNGPTTNAWNHYAIVQNGNSLNIYLNGIKSSSTYTGRLFNNADRFIFSGPIYNPVNGINGLIEDVYFTRKALWTSNFTPPTTYLPDNP